MVARRHCPNTAGHNHCRWGPARFRSLNFGERSGYLKRPARLRSLNFSECSGYLKGPAQYCSLDFDERNGYLKGPARFRSLDFGERNGYLKGVAPIDAQQKSMGLLTFSCSRDSSWAGTRPPGYGHHGWKRSHETLLTGQPKQL